ncbi:MAG: NADP-dependent isocitrate dehydrogenase [Planctomycetota bacterium]
MQNNSSAVQLEDSIPSNTDPIRTAITVARGDGIGPEIMDATLRILEAAGAELEIEEVAIGEAVYKSGITSGIGEEVWASLERTGVFLKAPITTPQGGGYKSLNVTTRKTLGLYANVRPCVAYAPFVRTKHAGMDVVIVRENEEDTYAGIEHQQTDEVVQCLKLVSRPGCERVIRYAFDYAVRNGRKKVTCMTKDNIMKLTDGMFRKVFDEVAAEYPDIQSDHFIIDIGAARMADTPEQFDVVVTMNLYGDILSDIAAQVAGSVGLAPSANIGKTCAMFEAIHGSAPDIAGQDIANPSGLLLAGVMMLRHLGQHDAAARVHNAWLAAVEGGIHTSDMRGEHHNEPAIGTVAFADAVIARLGQAPKQLPATSDAAPAIDSDPGQAADDAVRPTEPAAKTLVGVDVFLHWNADDRNPDTLAEKLRAASAKLPIELTMITNRGVKVWPAGRSETFCTDHWRCRFKAGGESFDNGRVIALLAALNVAGLDAVKTENLYELDGKPAYSMGQGE